RYVLLLADENGVVVDHRGEEQENGRFRVRGSWLGAVWTEALEGTNGIGTTLAEEAAVTIHKANHFRARDIDLSCSAAPIFGPCVRVIGIICITSIDPEVSEHAYQMAATLAVTAAQRIGERRFREAYRKSWIVAMRDPAV